MLRLVNNQNDLRAISAKYTDIPEYKVCILCRSEVGLEDLHHFLWKCKSLLLHRLILCKIMQEKVLGTHRRRSQIFVAGAERYKSIAHSSDTSGQIFCNNGSIA